MPILQKFSKIIHLRLVEFKFLFLFFGSKYSRHLRAETLNTKTAKCANSVKNKSRIKWSLSFFVKFFKKSHHFLLLFKILNSPLPFLFLTVLPTLWFRKIGRASCRERV